MNSSRRPKPPAQTAGPAAEHLGTDDLAREVGAGGETNLGRGQTEGASIFQPIGNRSPRGDLEAVDNPGDAEGSDDPGME